jgi:hypothetical protein
MDAGERGFAGHLVRTMALRGSDVARALARAWRISPPVWEPSRSELAAVKPILLGSNLGALGWWRLRRSAAARSPAGFELQQAYRLHAIETLLHERQLGRALGRLHAAGVEPLLARGWAAARHYAESCLRPYRHFDVYVGALQREAAFRALEGEDTPVSLNVGCADLNDRAWSRINERARSVPLLGGYVRVLGPEDHLRLLALQMLRRGACRPLWLCDVAAAVESTREGFDWEHFLSGEVRRTEWSCYALVLARDLIGAELNEAPPQVTRRALPRWLVRSVLRHWSAAARPEPRPRSSGGPAPSVPAPSRLPRWPNPIEATIGVGGPINGMPRLPFQLAECLSRTALRPLRRSPSVAG